MREASGTSWRVLDQLCELGHDKAEEKNTTTVPTASRTAG
jgi:hypothetical protein